MSAPPARTGLADTYPNPSNAVFRTAIGAFYDYVKGLLGDTGNAAEARNALGVGPVISFRNLLINANFAINQRGYISGFATTGANQYTLDRWRIVASGQNATFGAAAPDRSVTCPAGGLEQVIEGASIIGGVYTLSWTGTATAKVNGVAVVNGGSTASLPANTNVTVQFASGTVGLAQFEQGTVVTPFEHRPYALEFSMCQRYFEVGSARIEAYQGGIGALSYRVLFKQTKRATPTIVPTTNVSSNCSTASVINVGNEGLVWYAVSAAAGNTTYEGSWTASAEL